LVNIFDVITTEMYFYSKPSFAPNHYFLKQRFIIAYKFNIKHHITPFKLVNVLPINSDLLQNRSRYSNKLYSPDRGSLLLSSLYINYIDFLRKKKWCLRFVLYITLQLGTIHASCTILFKVGAIFVYLVYVKVVSAI